MFKQSKINIILTLNRTIYSYLKSVLVKNLQVCQDQCYLRSDLHAHYLFLTLVLCHNLLNLFISVLILILLLIQDFLYPIFTV
jgi:hypothetical protein